MIQQCGNTGLPIFPSSLRGDFLVVTLGHPYRNISSIYICVCECYVYLCFPVFIHLSISKYSVSHSLTHTSLTLILTLTSHTHTHITHHHTHTYLTHTHHTPTHLTHSHTHITHHHTHTYLTHTHHTPTHLLRTVIANSDVECILRAKNTPIKPDRKGSMTRSEKDWNVTYPSEPNRSPSIDSWDTDCENRTDTEMTWNENWAFGSGFDVIWKRNRQGGLMLQSPMFRDFSSSGPGSRREKLDPVEKTWLRRL